MLGIQKKQDEIVKLKIADMELKCKYRMIIKNRGRGVMFS